MIIQPIKVNISPVGNRLVTTATVYLKKTENVR